MTAHAHTPAADAVRPSVPQARGPVLQRKCACGTHAVGGECSRCAKKSQALQRRPAHGPRNAHTESVPGSVHEVLRSPGQPLGADTRAFFESRFGHDFSRVRVHTDAQAAESARAVNALAYTVGREIVFEAGRFAPHSSEGQKLLAHELAHVAQQQRGGGSLSLQHAQISEPDDAHEREADAAAAAVLRRGPAAGGGEVKPSASPGLLLQRQSAPGQNNRTCAGWESDAESFTKVIADFYYRTELGGTPGMADIQCQGDRRMCFITYPDGTSVTVSLARVPDFVIAAQRGGPGARREYVYDCETSGRVNLRLR